MINILKKNDFSLVLSGGGALGIAHLGVLADIEKYDLHPSEIIGTSMGGIIGACIAIGMKENEIYTQIETFSKVHKWIHFSFEGNSIVTHEKIEKIFNAIFKTKKMSDTIIPLKLIATNLTTGKKRVFTKDDDILLKDAVLATMAIPGIFEENIIENESYGDGFLCENLGLSQASYQTILAVDVLGENSFMKALPDNFFKTANVLEMFEKSMRLLIYNQTQNTLKYISKNIYLIEPYTAEYKTFQFSKHQELRNLGLNLMKLITKQKND